MPPLPWHQTRSIPRVQRWKRQLSTSFSGRLQSRRTKEDTNKGNRNWEGDNGKAKNDDVRCGVLKNSNTLLITSASQATSQARAQTSTAHDPASQAPTAIPAPGSHVSTTSSHGSEPQMDACV